MKAQQPERVVVGVEYSQELADKAAGAMDQVLQADLNHPDALDPLKGQLFDWVNWS